MVWWTLISSAVIIGPMTELRPLQPVTRIHASFLATGERRLLMWISSKLPVWVTPDQLTGLGLTAALLTALAYALSELNPLWLWLAVLGYCLNWFGDSLDGTLARYRKIERPAYGYFVDHSCDGLATLLIMGGLGLSPYVRLDVALLGAAGYLLLAVHTFLAAKATNVFKVSQGGLGPTEARLILIGLTLAMLLLGPDGGRLGVFNGFDLFVGIAAVGCIGIFVVQTVSVANDLLEKEQRSSR